MSQPTEASPVAAPLDLRERGAARDGEPQYLDSRLFMQLLVFNAPERQPTEDLIKSLAQALERRHIPGVIYRDVNNPRGIGLLSWSEQPEHFVLGVREVLNEGTFSGLQLRPEFTMLGRSYSSGFEPDLNYWLLRRPVETVTQKAWPWAVWYPLRRSGAFETLDSRERGGILHEHAIIGRAYGERNFAHDVRLACHGLDASDNEFVIGLMGPELYPLSHLVQAMRRTRQTSQYINQMGPFFVGHLAWHSQPPENNPA